MRYWGKVGIIRRLDELLEANDKVALCKNGRIGQHSQLGGTSKSRLFVKQWLVSYNGRTAVVKLLFDYRYGSGDVSMANDQAWWVALMVPGLAALMARLKPSSMLGTKEEWQETLRKGLFGRKK